MKKLFLLPVALMLAAGILPACTDTDEEPVRIEIGQEDLTQEFSSAAAERFVNVDANKLFDLKSSDNSWCTIKRTSNEFRVTGITISVMENLVVEDRSAEITLWSKDAEQVIIKVSQKAAMPYITVTEKSLLIKNNMTVGLHIQTNVEIDFELPAWIKRGAADKDAGIYYFTIDELGNAAPRDGVIVVKSKTIAGVDQVSVPVRQEEPVILPTAPEIPKEKYAAVWSDLIFTPEGYKDRAEGKDQKDPLKIIQGNAGAPETVWSSEINSYVLSYPTVEPEKFYTVLYCDLDGFKADGYALEGDGKGCSIEFYLKVTNTGNGHRIRPIGSFETNNGNWGIGLEIDDSDAFTFKVANGNSQWNTPELSPDNNTWDKTKWYHMLFIYDKPNDKVSLYVDGEKACEDRPFNAGSANKWLTLPWQDHHRGFGLGGNYRGLYNNEEYISGTNKMLTDGMTGEIAFFRLYDGSIVYTAEEIATRYDAIKTRSESTKFGTLQTMITQTLPNKAKTNISTDLQSAINSAIELGWDLMGNFEATEASVDAYLGYADELLNFE